MGRTARPSQFVLLLLLTGPLMPPPAARTTAQTAASQAADDVWHEMSVIRWSDTYPSWQAQHPQATCGSFSAPDEIVDALGPRDLWSYRCRERSGSIGTESLFYALDSAPPISARREQVRLSVGNLPVGQLEAAARELTSLVTAAHGAAAPGGIVEFGSAFWRETAHWESREVEIVIGVDEFPNRPPRLNVFVRHQPLLDAIGRFERAGEALASDLDGAGVTDAGLAADLRIRFPEAAALLTVPLVTPADTDAAVRSLSRLLDGAGADNRANAGERLFAADRLADRLAMPDRESAADAAQRRRLAAAHLTFEWSELGGSWVYTHDLLWRLWQDFGETPWAERAFVSLLARGWDTHVGCQAGPDQFRQVIPRANEYLRTHAAAPLRPEILFLVGQAYETWWSLSQASDRDEYADRRKYQDGADAARRQAIATYQEIVQRYPNSAHADYARLVLPRLQLGLDTDERRFFCVYD